MTTHWIGGNWCAGDAGEFATINPASNAPVWRGRAASAKKVDAAVHAASQAFPAWAELEVVERAQYLKEFARLLGEQKSALAHTFGFETGKPLWEALTEVATMIGKIDISLRAHEARTGTQRTQQSDGEAVLRHRPHGVVAVFGPYNFPGHLPNGHIVPALIAGNCVVFKPSELAAASAEATVKIWEQAGLPPGVLNLLQGGRETGIALAAHPSPALMACFSLAARLPAMHCIASSRRSRRKFSRWKWAAITRWSWEHSKSTMQRCTIS